MSVPAVRPVPNISGETRVGDTITPVAPDTKRVAGFTLAEPARLVKLSLCCDGAGGAAPTLVAYLRGVVFQGDALLAVGDEIEVMSGDALAWVDLPLVGSYPDGVTGAAGDIEYGVLVGGDPGVLRVAQIASTPPGGRWNADTYADGAADPFGGSVTTLTSTMSIFATCSPVWVPRDELPLDEVARMGWEDAQAILAGPVLLTPTYEVTATWHGTVVDANRGSFAVVRRAGPLAALAGRRLRITTLSNPPRSCVVFVGASVSSLDQDLSLARRAFADLELLAKDTTDVLVEVLA